MTSGLVFDIREFTVHDGPGIRTTVFMKGCPLACQWCHNPEGISPRPQVMRSAAAERVVGETYTAERLAALLSAQAGFLRQSDGGVTFSGGEPLLQAAFVAEVIELLDRLHVVLDTSGAGSAADFRLLAERSDLIYFDLKLIDPLQHHRYTGCDNAAILRNLSLAGTLGRPLVIRVPLVPGVTDTDRNLAAIAAMVGGLPGLLRVDLLPYNRAAGGKYEALGMRFAPAYDEAQAVHANSAIFSNAGIAVRVA